MLFNVENPNGTTATISLTGNLTEVDLRTQFTHHLLLLEYGGINSVLLDCSAIRKCTSTGLTGLIELLLSEDKIAFAAFGLSKKITNRLLRLGFGPALPVYESAEMALKSARMRKLRMSQTRAVVLCAGRGSRMGPLSETCPKPMLDILGMPILARLLDHLEGQGLRDIILNPGHLGHLVHEFFADHPTGSQSIFFANEGSWRGSKWSANPIGSASTLKKLQRENEAFQSDFSVFCGDALTDVDLSEVLDFHVKNGADATIVAMPVERHEVIKYGIIDAPDGTRVLEFQEKPKPVSAKSNLANIGIYIFSPAALNVLPDETGLDIGTHLLPRLLQSGAKVLVHSPEFTWTDVGCGRDYFNAISLGLKGLLPGVQPFGRQIESNVWLGENAQVSSSASFDGACFVSAGARISGGAQISGACYIGASAEVQARTITKNSIVLPNTVVGAGAIVDGQITSGEWSMSHAYATGRSKASQSLEHVFVREDPTIVQTRLSA